ncbi:MAG: phosphoribosylanthranilate isomerase [Bradymonadia bacterium]|jgi:phosphoribosylanthranilate isomerase
MATSIKICGIRDADSLAKCIALGVDWVGFNFVPDSKRWIEPEAAAALIATIPSDGPIPVGVFKDQAPNNVLRVARKAAIKIVQLHGEEPVPYCAAVGGAFDIWKALPGDRMTKESFEDYASVVDGFVLDGRIPGSGEGWDYAAAAEFFGIYNDLPVLLAGGLHPVNVAAALRASSASGADVASGVEEGGQMRPELIEEFVRNARGGVS